MQPRSKHIKGSKGCYFIIVIMVITVIIIYLFIWPNKHCSFQPLMCLDFVLERWQSFLFQILVIMQSSGMLAFHKSWGESVAQSKSTHSQKAKLSTIVRGHQMDGWPLLDRLCAHPEISLESNSVQTPQNSFRWDYKPRSHTYVKDPVVHVRVWWTMEKTK